MPPKDAMSDLTPEERAFLAELARTGVASRRVWRIAIIGSAGTAAVCGAIAGIVSLIHLVSGAR